MKSYHAGFDYFTPDPGKEQSLQCRGCGSEMSVERNIDVGSRYPHINPEFKRKVDRFTCQHSGERWHDQAIALRKLINRTPSRAIAELVEIELAEVIKNQQPSKEQWSF
jgi:hypothetical protein